MTSPSIFVRLGTALVVTMVATVVGYGLVGADAATDGNPVLGPGDATVLLTIDGSVFSTDRLVVAEGTTLRFVVVNDDPILHELIVGGPDVHARHEGGHEARHAPVPGEVTVDPDGIATTTFSFDEPGTVAFACHLPGHVAYGMVGQIIVEPA